MNNLQKRKLRKRLLAVVVSICACIAIMGVGVYAATATFSVQVSNEVDVNISKVDGSLSAKRGGDVVYGTVSLGDQGTDASGKGPQSAVMSDFVLVYDNFDIDGDGAGDGYGYNSENKTEIEEPVNFYLSAKDESGKQKEELTIFYVFKFEFHAGSPEDVLITVTNESTQLTDSRKDFVSMNFKYIQGKAGLVEPSDWGSAGTSLGIETIASGSQSSQKSLTVKNDDVNTHVVYIYASMTVQRTNTLETAYTLGVDTGDEFRWKFGVSFEPTNVA